MMAFTADTEADGVPIYESYYRLSQLLWMSPKCAKGVIYFQLQLTC